jgi:hypothetical protein
MRAVRRRPLLAGGALGATALVAALLVVRGSQPQAASDDNPGAVELSTAVVETRDLVAEVTFAGTLTAAPAVDIPSGRAGTITEAAAVGTDLSGGSVLARIDGQPVFVLDGATPAWRELVEGVTVGVDVQQLEQFLTAGAHDSGNPVTVDQELTAATTAAVKHWQTATGQEATGTVALGTVVFVPGPVTVAQPAVLGAAVKQGGSLAQVVRPSDPATATLDVPVGDVSMFEVGAIVGVEPADGRTVDGKVTSVATTTLGEAGSDATETTVADTTPTVAVTLEVTGIEGPVVSGPVTAHVPSQTAQGVLAVPTRALVALAEGGQGVEVVDGEATDIVPVETGLYADGWVEIRADSLSSGDAVVVPA